MHNAQICLQVWALVFYVKWNRNKYKKDRHAELVEASLPHC
ncbi:hypothetical protein SAMN06265337_0063 [Hymenobacter gelipurpurascens]|uniref:Uncharacterized protein n=1 Tax=Hymenobacter gelipurpurascens TaxID=89968 RepID=A0A212T0C6_9BACT|nr:hypothetical protein SAMN06265337_0063 [Hymenobacter gelipurpurascens]